jgi:tRNA-dihydrouridine synthase
MGYLLGSSVNLKAFSLGKQEVPLRIYTNGGVLNLEARDAYLEGVGTGDPLQINRYIVNNLTLKNPEQFIWSLDRSDALYKDIYEFYGIDWQGYPLNYDAFYQSVQRRKATKNQEFEDLELENLELKDLELEDLELEEIVRSKQEARAHSQNLVILKDAENVKIAENQQ